MTAAEKQRMFFSRDDTNANDGKAHIRKGWNKDHHAGRGTQKGGHRLGFVDKVVGKDILGRDIVVKSKVKDDYKTESISRLTKFGTTTPKSKGGTSVVEHHDEGPELTMAEMQIHFLDRRTSMTAVSSGVSNGTQKTFVKLNSNHRDKDISMRARAPTDDIVSNPGNSAKGAGASFVNASPAKAKPTALKPTMVPSTFAKKEEKTPDRSRERPKGGKGLDIGGLFAASSPARESVRADERVEDEEGTVFARHVDKFDSQAKPQSPGAPKPRDPGAGSSSTDMEAPLSMKSSSGSPANGGGTRVPEDGDDEESGEAYSPTRAEASQPSLAASGGSGGLASFATKFDRKSSAARAQTQARTRTPPGSGGRSKGQSSGYGKGRADSKPSPSKGSRNTPPSKGTAGSLKARSRSTPPMSSGRAARQRTPVSATSQEYGDSDEEDEPTPPPPSGPPPGRAMRGANGARQPPPAPMNIPAGRGKGVSNMEGLSPAPSPSNEPPLGALLEALDQGGSGEAYQRWYIIKALAEPSADVHDQRLFAKMTQPFYTIPRVQVMRWT